MVFVVGGDGDHLLVFGIVVFGELGQTVLEQTGVG